jgi:hypothetical protein
MITAPSRDLEQHAPSLCDREQTPSLHGVEVTPTSPSLRDREQTPTSPSLRGVEVTPTSLRDREQTPTPPSLRGVEVTPTSPSLRDREQIPTAPSTKDNRLVTAFRIVFNMFIYQQYFGGCNLLKVVVASSRDTLCLGKNVQGKRFSYILFF